MDNNTSPDAPLPPEDVDAAVPKDVEGAVPKDVDGADSTPARRPS
jgi:hypothetical protein